MSGALTQMTDEKVTQAWAADVRTDCYLLSTGEMIVSVATQVFSEDGQETIGFMEFDVYVNSLSELLSGITVGETGYFEVLSNDSVYIYSNDPTAMDKNVEELDISDEYKQKKVSINANSAAASKELSTQALLLKELIGRFYLNVES